MNDDALQEIAERLERRPELCIVAASMEAVDDPDVRALVEQALTERNVKGKYRVGSRLLAKALGCSEGRVRDHRRGECNCPGD